MINKNKKLFLFFLFALLVFAFILSAHLVLADTAPKGLEGQYPEVQGYKPELVTIPIEKYAKYIFNFAIWISGFIALIVLIYAGFEYFTSAGNPGKIQDAKNRISAAFLGLIILFGSYLILTTINPGLISFRLERLTPIISTLNPGVLVCQGQPKTKDGNDAVTRVYQLTNNFPYEPYWRQREIKEELEEIFKEISSKCYTVITAGNIRPDLDNKITDIYFIPGEKLQQGTGYLALYGAILYEGRNFQDKSLACYNHFQISPGGVYEPVHRDLTKAPFYISEPSSIKPYILNWTPDANWHVSLYQKSNFNKDIDLKGRRYPDPTHPFKPGDWYRWGDMTTLTDSDVDGKTVPPKSIYVEGNILGILFTADGRSEVFSKGDSNLINNNSIVDYEPCITHPIDGCPEVKATSLLIISAGLN